MSELLRRDRALRTEGTGAASAAAPAKSAEGQPISDRETILVMPPPTENVAEGSATDVAAAVREAATSTPLFSPAEAAELRSRWDSIQVGFVDEPRRAVQEADALVSSTTKRLAEFFSGERQKLERQRDRGGELSTEELRVALRRYRSFFTRLLSV
jgi:hypothetical protein